MITQVKDEKKYVVTARFYLLPLPLFGSHNKQVTLTQQCPSITLFNTHIETPIRVFIQ